MMHGFVQYLIHFKHDGVDHVVDDQLEVGMSEPLSNVLLSAYNTMMRDQVRYHYYYALLFIVSLLLLGVSRDNITGCICCQLQYCSTL